MSGEVLAMPATPRGVMRAAAVRVRTGRREATKASWGQEWQAEAWRYFDCLDAQTEILTEDGWVTHDQLVAGMRALALRDDGTTGWEVVEEVRRHDVTNVALLAIEKQRHSSRSTFHHRWPVLHQQWNGPKRIGLAPVWRISAELDPNQDYIRTAAPYSDAPAEAKYSDAFVELMAWFWTEGTVRQNRRSPSVVIAQSHAVNPAYCARIRSVLTALYGPSSDAQKGRMAGPAGWHEYRRPRISHFKLNVAASAPLTDIAPDKVIPAWFIRALTRAQLELFIDVSMKADGHIPTAHISQADPRRLEAFDLACILSGRTPRRMVSRTETKEITHVGDYDHVAIRKQGWSVERYTGIIWCPKTASGTWMARRNGTVYFTGNTLGEVKYATYYVANLVARLALQPAVWDPIVGTYVAVDAGVEPGVDQALDALRGPEGHGPLLRESAVNTLIAGEFFLVGLPDPDALVLADEDEGLSVGQVVDWTVRSIDEVKVAPSGGYEIRDSPDDKHPRKVTDQTAYVLRIWSKHPRYSNLADSCLRGVLATCEELERSERFFRSAAISRAMNGILAIPDDIDLPAADDEALEDDPTGTGQEDRFLRMLAQALESAISDEGSARAILQILLRGNRDSIAAIRTIDLAKPLEEKLLQREQSLMRLAQGLNVPVEVVTGKADLNHWNAWNVDEQTFANHVAPIADLIVGSYQSGYLWPLLEAGGMTREEARMRGIVYDPRRVVTRPNRGADADFGLKSLALSWDGWRREKDFPDDYAPSPEELALRLAARSFGPADDGQDQGGAPLADAAQIRRLAAAATPAPGVKVGRRLLEIDRTWRNRLSGLLDAALERALERAGARLRSRLRNGVAASVMNTVPNRVLASTLGVNVVAAAEVTEDALLDAAFATLRPLFLAGNARARRAARQTLDLDAEPSAADRDADEAAWSWLLQNVTDLARRRLYDPDPAVPDVGEVAGTAVPARMAREAIARAGGSGGLIEVDGIPGGIAVGVTIQSELADTGGGVDGWIWDYGAAPRLRPFEPHEALDGYEFSTWDDPGLANGESWPNVAYYAPGDHDGCLCDWIPIVRQAGTIEGG